MQPTTEAPQDCFPALGPCGLSNPLLQAEASGLSPKAPPRSPSGPSWPLGAVRGPWLYTGSLRSLLPLTLPRRAGQVKNSACPVFIFVMCTRRPFRLDPKLSLSCTSCRTAQRGSCTLITTPKGPCGIYRNWDFGLIYTEGNKGSEGRSDLPSHRALKGLGPTSCFLASHGRLWPLAARKRDRASAMTCGWRVGQWESQRTGNTRSLVLRHKLVVFPAGTLTEGR